MKIYGKLLALCVFHVHVWGTAAFVQAPITSKTAQQQSDVALHSILTSVMEKAASSFTIPQVKKDARVVKAPKAAKDKNTPSLFGRRQETPIDIWDTIYPVKVQGSSLRTWSFESSFVDRVQVLLKSDGRPLNANVALWQGPDNIPQEMGIYVEDGRPFSAVIETPRGSNAIAVRNTGSLEFPFAACVVADTSYAGLGAATQVLSERGGHRTVQGGSVLTYPFFPSVESVQLLLKTYGRPLNARIELLQGPNNVKQVMELYTENGMDRPFFAVIETPAIGNVVRIVNKATVEYPITAYVEPYTVKAGTRREEPLMGSVTGGAESMRQFSTPVFVNRQ